MNMKYLLLFTCVLALGACQTTDSKYAEVKEKNLSCADISMLHKSNEAFVDEKKPIADRDGPGINAAAALGGLLFAPVGLVASIKQIELYKYRENLRENEALRRLAADKSCPVPSSKYPVGLM